MKRILVTGAGGSPSANFIRSLRAADEEYYIVGTDADKYYLQRAEVDARSEEHTSELQSRQYLVCRLLLEKKNCSP